MKAETMDASASSNYRIPDSRLPGVEPCEEPVQQKPAAAEEEVGDHGYELSVLALWPIFFMLTLALTVAIATAWYGPKKVLQIVLQHLVPANPHAGHVCAIWLAIVGCITLGIPVLLVLLPIPSMMVGFWYGMLITATAETFAACLSFVIGRTIAQRPLRRFLEGRGFTRIMRCLHVMEDQDEQSMQLLILYRFMTMPMALRNYGPSILNVPMSKLVVSAIPHSLWSAVVFSTAGAALKGPAQLIRDGHKIAWKTPAWQQVVGLIIAIISFTLFGAIAGRAYWRKIEAEESRQRLLKGSEEGVNAVHYGTSTEGVTPETRSSGS